MQRPLSLAVALILLAACGGSGQRDQNTPDSAADRATSSAESPAAAPPEVTIVATDFAYEAPDTIAGGLVSLRLVNHGTTLHHVQLVRLLEGKTYHDLTEGLKQMKPGNAPPPWIEDVVGPNAPEPGGESRLIRELAPGSYAILCFVDLPDRVPHLMKGMMKPLTVTAPPAAVAATPASDITVQMTDYDWALSTPLTAGKHVIRLENQSQQSHEMFIARLDAGRTKEDFLKWGMTYQGAPPGKAIGGTTGQKKGDVVYLPVELEPGNYLLVCFVPDAKDGKPHLAHGMIKEIAVS
ncbi:MAG: hypothetical protein IT359_02475 [Gemmatimonadaceae bacterium]|nr:hypothetical protein [Gemmatimonadaceae bacterium]